MIRIPLRILWISALVYAVGWYLWELYLGLKLGRVIEVAIAAVPLYVALLVLLAKALSFAIRGAYGQDHGSQAGK
jgi:hypothetical protein